MEKKMSVMGIGDKAGIIVGLYLVITIVLSYAFKPFFKLTAGSTDVLITVGIIVAAVGFSLCLVAAFQMLKAHKQDRLATTGMYAIFLHPMYFMQLLVTVPGITLLFNSWLVLTTVVVALIAVRILVKQEDRYLENRYGDEYRAYVKKVLIKF